QTMKSPGYEPIPFSSLSFEVHQHSHGPSATHIHAKNFQPKSWRHCGFCFRSPDTSMPIYRVARARIATGDYGIYNEHLRYQQVALDLQNYTGIPVRGIEYLTPMVV